MAAIDPVIETALAVVNPAAGLVSKVVLTEAESLVAGTETAPVVAVVPPPAAPAADPAPAPAAPASSTLQASDVINALMQTLVAMQAKL